MKKSLFILCTVLLLALLVACGTTNDTPASEYRYERTYCTVWNGTGIMVSAGWTW